MKTDHLYIEDSPYHLGGELIDISDFSNLKLDKKDWKDLAVYYINYVNKNKQPVDITNQLYISINNVSGYISEENGKKFLTITKEDSVSKKYNSVFSALQDLTASKEGKIIIFNDGYDKIKFLSNADLVLNTLLHFPALAVVIRCFFKQGDVFYSQVYLDDGRYQL